jgi:iron complex transport system substrate-binding protein
MNPLSMDAIKGGILETIFPDAVKISTEVVKGGRFTPNIETILSLAPDVVFQWADNGDHLIEPLDRVGLRVLGMKYGTQADLEYYTGMAGQVAGKTDKVKDLFAKFHAKRAEIEAKVAAIPPAQRPGVIYFARYHQLNAFGIKTYHDFYVTMVGGRNVTEGVVGFNTNVTVEQVLAWNPEIILLGNFDAATPEDVYKDPRWQALPAVRNRRVYKVPVGGVRWDPPGEESVLSWMWHANLVHPRRFAYDIRGETRAHYRFLHGYELNDAQLDKILRVSDNKASVHYTAMTAASAR